MKMTKPHYPSTAIILIVTISLLISLFPQEVYANTPSQMPHGWGYVISKNHKAPYISKSTKKLLKKYDAYYVHNTKEKVIYLTFDLGYENGCTTKILNVLDKHKIKATFFVCKAFIDSNPKGLKRMVREGHAVGNHTVNHIALYKLSSNRIKSELERVRKAYKKVTGKEMSKIVRPPEGGYSEKSLADTKKLGYSSIFWSIAMPNDWNLKNQPSKYRMLSLFPSQYHNGAIVLLHGISPAVADNLDQMLTQLEKKGYKFKLITDIHKKNGDSIG